ncbi:MAG: hypothetical protein U9Q80_05685 [Bacillota bacterium]|nr:hypothetical protein [Bacillota bacterium]
MEFKKIAKYIFVTTVVVLIVANLINYNPIFRIFVGSFGIGSSIVLWIIGNVSHDD